MRMDRRGGAPQHGQEDVEIQHPEIRRGDEKRPDKVDEKRGGPPIRRLLSLRHHHLHHSFSDPVLARRGGEATRLRDDYIPTPSSSYQLVTRKKMEEGGLTSCLGTERIYFQH